MKTRILVVAVGLVFAARAEAAEVSFSAQAIQQMPNQAPQTGMIYKSGTAMRMEFEQQGQKVIQIVDPAQGLMRMLFPQQRAYMEQRNPGPPPGKPTQATNPCGGAQAAGATCQKSGVKKFAGIDAEEWIISPKDGSGQVRAYWDPRRRQLVGQVMPDGSMTQDVLVGMETVEGRKVEHWRATAMKPGKEPQTMERWFDPELEVNVREDLPGGVQRAFKNIKIGPIDPAMFQVPQGYRKIDPPRQQGGQQPRGAPRQGGYQGQPPPGYGQPQGQPPRGYGQQGPYQQR